MMFLLVLCCLAALSARARAETSVEPPGYRETINEALAEYELQNYAESNALFVRAHKLYPNARTLRGLAFTSFELRRYTDTISYCEQALASKRKPLDLGMRGDMERLLTRARGFVGQLSVSVEPSSARMVVDGAAPAPVPDGPLLLELGTHRLEFIAPGYDSERRLYLVRGGERDTWRIALREEAKTTAAAPDVVPPPSEPPRPLGRWQKGLGVAALMLGTASIVATGLLSARRHSYAVRLRDSLPPPSDEYPAAYNAWHSARRAPYAFAAVGSVLVAGGGLTLLALTAPRAAPWWVWALSSAAGAGLSAWGLSEVIRGGSCAELIDHRDCAKTQERRDRGALVLLGIAPLWIVPIVQLIRPARAPTAGGEAAFLLSPQATHRAISVTAHLRWL